MRIMYRNLLFVLLLLLILGSALLFYVAKSTTPILKPQVTSSQNKAPKRIVGFLPYWQMENIDAFHFDLLSEVAFFGLHINEKGEVVKEDLLRLQNDSFANLQQKTKGVNLAIVLTLQDNEKLETFLKDQSAWQTVSEQLQTVIEKYNLLGIHIDFEYAGIPAKETIAGFTTFVQTLNKNLKKKHPNLLVTVDITADAVKKSRLYDVEKLAKEADFIVLMGYDFYRPTSGVAGPVAPLLGKEIYEYDVTTAVSDFLTFVPKEKLMLGVPYYGWDFPTVDDTRGSSVEKRPDETVALSTYKRNKRLIDEGNATILLDNDSQTPWMVYHDPDTNGIRQIWFEDETSLGKKYDLVSKENLGGVAIWALGYDGDHQELWDLLKIKFR